MAEQALIALIAAVCSFDLNVPKHEKVECAEKMVNCAITANGTIKPEKEVYKCVSKSLR